MLSLINKQLKYYLAFPLILIFIAFCLTLSSSSKAQNNQEIKIVNYPISITNIPEENNLSKITSNADTEEELKVDDGTLDGRGLLGDGLIIANRLTPSSYPATLKTIRIVFPSFQGQPSPIGRNIKLVAFLDPSGKGVPSNNPNFVLNVNAIIPSVNSYVDFPITTPIQITSGDIYIGYQSPNPALGVGFAADTNGFANRRSYFSSDNGITFKGPLIFSDGTDANIMIRAVVSKPSQQTGDFSLTLDPLAQQVIAGQEAKFTVKTQAISGFTGTISLVSAISPSDTNIQILLSPTAITVGNNSSMTVKTFNNTPSGNYRITITGSSGVQTHSEVINLTVIQEKMPTLTVKASNELAYEEKTVPGSFLISRTEELTQAVTVNYSLSGTAVIGEDYLQIGTQVVIPAGQTSVTVSIIPFEDTLAEGNETVILTLSESPSYKLASPKEATITIVDNDNWEKLTSTTVDKKGGTVAAAGMSITIPKKTFKTPATLEIYRGIGVSKMDETRVSEVYQIKGLPPELYKAVTLTVEMKNHEKVATPFIVLEAEVFVPSLGRVEKVQQTVTTTQQGNQLSATLPTTPKSTTATLLADETGKTSPLIGRDRDVTYSNVYAIEWTETYSPARRFLIRSPVNYKGLAAYVGGFADLSYSTLEGYGIPLNKRTLPILIQLYGFGASERTGETSAGFLGAFWGPNHYFINLNANRMSDTTVMKETVSHELCHLAQSLYDSRSYYAMASGPDGWFWLEEAICTWFEWKMTDPTKVPKNVAEDKYNFLLNHGLYFPPATSSEEEITLMQNHGYGSSMFLSYLTQRAVSEKIGNGAIASVVRYRANARNPIDVLKQQILIMNDGQIENLWTSFCRAWLVGDIYPNRFPGPQEIIGTANNTFELKDPGQGSIVIDLTSQDLSANLYLFKLKNTLKWGSKTKMKFTLTGQNTIAYIAKYDTNTKAIEILSDFSDKYQIDNAEVLANEQQSLLVLVVNNRASTPYTGTSSSELTLDIEKSFESYYEQTHTAYLYNQYLAADVSLTLQGDHKVVRELFLNPNTQETHLMSILLPKLNPMEQSKSITVSMKIEKLRAYKSNYKNPVIKELVFRIVDAAHPSGQEQRLSNAYSMTTTLVFTKDFTKASSFSIYAVFADKEVTSGGIEILNPIGSSDLEGIDFTVEK